MALKKQEVEVLRKVICSTGRVTPELLAKYATMTDEEVRTELTNYKKRLSQMLDNLKKQVSDLG